MEQALNKTSAVKAACGGLNHLGLIAGGLGAGALLMYLLDPDRGRGRRAKITDQVTSKANQLSRAAGSKARHLRNRVQGVAHEIGLTRDNESENAPSASRNYGSIEQAM